MLVTSVARIRSILVGLVGVAILLLPAPRAEAEVTCTLDEFEQPHVFLRRNGDSVALRVSGTDIQFKPGGMGWASCAGATTTETQILTVRDLSSGNVSVTIDLSGGPFAPGFEDEPGDSDEIEWWIDLGGGGNDRLAVRGTGGPDEWTFGRKGFNLNPAEDGIAGTPLDNDALRFVGVDRVFMRGLGGADGLRAHGGAGTGGALPIPVVLLGHGATDVLEGGQAADVLKGGPGGDEMSGLGGADRLDGGTGGDEMDGGGGNDVVRGGRGDDSLFGGPGADRLSGGPGTDWCSGGPGADRFGSCERGPRD